MTRNQTLLSIGGFLLLLAIFIYLFTGHVFTSIFKVANNKEVADVIDALSAPVIGIAGAILVYISFREQVKANKIQFLTINEQRDLELMYKFYEELKQDLHRMQGEYGRKYGQSAILDSLMNYVYDNKHADSPYPEFEQYLVYVFNQFIFISNRIKRNKTLSPSEIVYIIEKVRYLYDLYLRAYHKKLTTVLLDTAYGKQIKNELDKVNVQMLKLEKLHLHHKDNLRAGKEQD